MRIIAAAASVLVLVSCTQATAPTPATTGGFLGATSANASAFTSTEDGCTYSFLFDHFGIQRTPPAAGVGPQSAGDVWVATLSAPAHAAGAQVSIDVRGAILGDGASGQLEISFAGESDSFEIATPADPAANNGFVHRLSAPIVDGANTLSVTINLPAMPATEAQVQIDSVDLAIQGAEFCRAAAAPAQ